MERGGKWWWVGIAMVCGRDLIQLVVGRWISYVLCLWLIVVNRISWDADWFFQFDFIALTFYDVQDDEVWNSAASNCSACKMKWFVVVMWEAFRWYVIWHSVISYNVIASYLNESIIWFIDHSFHDIVREWWSMQLSLRMWNYKLCRKQFVMICSGAER